MSTHPDLPSTDLPRTRFIITSLPRVGTSYVTEQLIAAYPVKNYGEVLRMPRPGDRPQEAGYAQFRQLAGKPIWSMHPRRNRRDYIDMLLTTSDEQPIVGLKLLGLDWCWPRRGILRSPFLLRATAMPGLVDFVASEGLPVLLFVRENIVKLLVSTSLALRDGSWSSHHERRSQTIALDPKKVLRDLKRLEASQNLLVDRCKRFNTTTVAYESPNQLKLDLVTSALGLPNIGIPAVERQKQTPNELDRVIENFDEVARALLDTRFESQLHG